MSLPNLPSATNPISPTIVGPQPTTYFGLRGWWTVPANWYEFQVGSGGWAITVNPNGTLTATDTSGRTYALKTNQTGELVFQTLFPGYPWSPF
jgi:hypothetical protein